MHQSKGARIIRWDAARTYFTTTRVDSMSIIVISSGTDRWYKVLCLGIAAALLLALSCADRGDVTPYNTATAVPAAPVLQPTPTAAAVTAGCGG